MLLLATLLLFLGLTLLQRGLAKLACEKETFPALARWGYSGDFAPPIYGFRLRFRTSWARLGRGKEARSMP